MSSNWSNFTKVSGLDLILEHLHISRPAFLCGFTKRQAKNLIKASNYCLSVGSAIKPGRLAFSGDLVVCEDEVPAFAKAFDSDPAQFHKITVLMLTAKRNDVAASPRHRLFFYARGHLWEKYSIEKTTIERLVGRIAAGKFHAIGTPGKYNLFCHRCS